MRWTSCLCIMLAGCGVRAPDPGTAIGNPPDSVMRLGPSDLPVRTAQLDMAQITLTSCDEEPEEYSWVEEYSLLRGPAFTLPPGQWCQVQIAITSLRVEIDTGRVVTLDVRDEQLHLQGDGPAELAKNTHYLIELGNPGWLDGVVVLVEAEDVIGPGHLAYDQLVQGLQDGSALWHDEDGDGSLSQREREAGSIMSGQWEGADWPSELGTGSRWQEPSPDENGGCSTWPSAPPWLALFPLLLLIARRRSR